MANFHNRPQAPNFGQRGTMNNTNFNRGGFPHQMQPRNRLPPPQFVNFNSSNPGQISNSNQHSLSHFTWGTPGYGPSNSGANPPRMHSNVSQNCSPNRAVGNFNQGRRQPNMVWNDPKFFNPRGPPGPGGFPRAHPPFSVPFEVENNHLSGPNRGGFSRDWGSRGRGGQNHYGGNGRNFQNTKQNPAQKVC